MALAHLTYNASSGSDTAASGSNAPTTAHTDVTLSATVSGTASTTTMTFSATIDLTGVNNDGTDVIWAASPAGEQALFRITAFTGGVSTCTGLTVSQTIGGSGLSAVSWAIGGKRQTMINDNTLPDWDNFSSSDPVQVEFDDGTYSTDSTAGTINWDGGDASNEPSVIRASSSATSKPVLNGNVASQEVVQHNVGQVIYEGLKFTQSNASGFACLWVSLEAEVTFIDCAFTTANSGAVQNVYIGSGGQYAFIGCHFTRTAGTAALLGFNADFTKALVFGCTFNGASNAQDGILIANSRAQMAITISHCLIYDCTDDGIGIGTINDECSYWITFCTITDNTGDAISVVNSDIDTALHVLNCLLTYNGGYGVNLNSGANYMNIVDWCAFYSNTSGETINLQTSRSGANNITLTADPYTARASDDYSLNDTAGGGAAIEQAGLPGAFPDGT